MLRASRTSLLWFVPAIQHIYIQLKEQKNYVHLEEFVLSFLKNCQTKIATERIYGFQQIENVKNYKRCFKSMVQPQQILSKNYEGVHSVESYFLTQIDIFVAVQKNENMKMKNDDEKTKMIVRFIIAQELPYIRN